MRLWGVCFILGVAMTLAGCGPMFLPGRAKGPVADTDVVGRWRYLGDYKATTIEIEFAPDHHFVQTVTGPGGATKTQRGTWKLKDASLDLENVLMNNSVSGFSLSHWVPESTSWWFTDELGYLQLLGGEHGDPDCFFPLERLSTTAAPLAPVPSLPATPSGKS